MQHCRNLQFEEKPNYNLLTDILKGLARKEGLDLDYKSYDWVKKIEQIPKPIEDNDKDASLIVPVINSEVKQSQERPENEESPA